MKKSSLIIAMLMATAPAHANLIGNGSFETPTVPNGGFTNFSIGATIPSWSVVGSSPQSVSIVSGAFQQSGVTFLAQDGNQWLDLTGDGSNGAEGVSQAITTILGHTYKLSYYIGNTTGGIFGTTSTVNLSIAERLPQPDPLLLSFSDTNATVSPTTLNWLQVMHSFVAVGTSTTFTFLNGDPGGDNSNGLDNVVLIDEGVIGGGGGPITEPASLAVLGVGLAALGYWRRKPRNSSD
jgi:hypothetical protein